jgi:hypothetical protein
MPIPSGGIRTGESGTLLPGIIKAATPAAITAPNTNDTVITDAAFIGASSVVASFAGAPGANLGILAAWVSNAATGAITVRCAAVGGNFVSAAQNFFIQRLS